MLTGIFAAALLVNYIGGATAIGTEEISAMRMSLSLSREAAPIMNGASIPIRLVFAQESSDPHDLLACATLRFDLACQSWDTDPVGYSLDLLTTWPPDRIEERKENISYAGEVGMRYDTPLLAGQYVLTASLVSGSVTAIAATAKIRVENFTPRTVMRLGGVDGDWLSSVVVQPISDGFNSVYYSYVDTDAFGSGTLQPVFDFSSRSPSSFTSSIVPTDPESAKNVWLAVSDGRVIFIAEVTVNRDVKRVEPIPLDSKSAELVPTGLFTEDGSVTFVAFDVEQTALFVIRIGADGKKSVSKLHARNLAKRTSPIVSITGGSDNDSLYLSWVTESHDVQVLSFRASDPTATLRTKVIFRAQQRIATIQAEPKHPFSPSWVHVITEPNLGEDTLTLVRLNPASGQLVDTASLPAPPRDTRTLQTWLIASTKVHIKSGIAAVASNGNWLYYNGKWKQFRVPSEALDHPELIWFAGKYWISGWSSKSGPRLYPLE